MSFGQKLFLSFLRLVVFPVIRFIWVGKVEGLEKIPTQGGVIIASNHESYFDFICMSAISPRPIYYLAAEVFYKKWWWRPIMTLTGQIKLERYGTDKKESAQKAMQKAIELLQAGQLFGIFPEGTRSPDGKLQKAYTGVAKITLRARVPVVPVGMIGTFEIMSRHSKIPKFKKFTIRIGQPLNFEQYYRQENEITLRKITTRIMKQIAALCGEQYNHDKLCQ